jgi:hypothetical protein
LLLSSLTLAFAFGSGSPPWLARARAASVGEEHRAGDSPGPADRLIAQGTCPCGCGNALPDSGRAGACFGCSVGKAEVTFIRESLARGLTLGEVLVAMRESVVVEVFADYDDARLPEVWRRVRRAADELGQHRVVLRTPGQSANGRRALAVAECARGSGRFGALQSALIEHSGSFASADVLDLASEALRDRAVRGTDHWTPEAMRACSESVDLAAQLERDRQHAKQRGMRTFPAVAVDRQPIPDTLDAMREAIRAALRKGSV